ncbi:hypothetical protein T02_5774 [Trichinella nativa]|uniref:Uncharacterized protein n=1 Tax=Trichinella nativa TaxID=6335 RepID=A0A0V1LGV9_9BILA|nr:hypothetical protein T02_5774 [Trichinella nativa]
MIKPELIWHVAIPIAFSYCLRMLLDIAGKITENYFLKCYHINEVKFLKKERKNNYIVKMKKASELVGVMKHYLIEPISSLTYVKGDLGYTSLNTISVEEEIELRFHSRFLIGVALMIRYILLLGYKTSLVYLNASHLMRSYFLRFENLGIIYALVMPCLLILIIGIVLAVISNNSYLILQVTLQEAYLIKYSVL